MELSISSSEIHAAMKRDNSVRLMDGKGKGEAVMPNAKNLEEFVVCGVKYVFSSGMMSFVSASLHLISLSHYVIELFMMMPSRQNGQMITVRFKA